MPSPLSCTSTDSSPWFLNRTSRPTQLDPLYFIVAGPLSRTKARRSCIETVLHQLFHYRTQIDNDLAGLNLMDLQIVSKVLKELEQFGSTVRPSMGFIVAMAWLLEETRSRELFGSGSAFWRENVTASSSNNILQFYAGSTNEKQIFLDECHAPDSIASYCPSSQGQLNISSAVDLWRGFCSKEIGLILMWFSRHAFYIPWVIQLIMLQSQGDFQRFLHAKSDMSKCHNRSRRHFYPLNVPE